MCLVQSDKATVEITSRYDGVVKKLHHKIGEMAKVGSPLMDIDLGGAPSASASAPASTASAAPSSAAAAPASTSAPASTAANGGGAVSGPMDEDGKPMASPAVRRIAKENNINLALVTGSGPKGMPLHPLSLRSDVLCCILL